MQPALAHVRCTAVPSALLSMHVSLYSCEPLFYVLVGKTAAFMLPILERLLYKPKQAPVTRVLILSPTRELAVQIHTVAKQLAQFTSVEISLSAGALSSAAAVTCA